MFRKAGTTRVNIYYPWALWNNYYSNQKEGVSLSCKYFFEKVHTRNQIMDLKDSEQNLIQILLRLFTAFFECLIQMD